MSSATASPRRIQFDSEALSAELDERGRLTYWHDLFVNTLVQVEMSYLPHRPFSANFRFEGFDGAGVNRLEVTTSGMHRTSRHIAADPNGDFYLGFNVGPAPWSFERRDRQLDLGQASAVFFSVGEVGRIVSPSGFAVAAVIVPRRQLLTMVPGAEDRIATPLDPNSEALRHLARYLDIVTGPWADDQRPTADPALAEHISTTLLDLLALVLHAQGDAAALANARGLRAARLQAILAGIRAGAADPRFNAATLARNLGLSERYIRQLLHEAGTSFRERVLELRLQRARTMLGELRYSGLQVSEIAYACGFSDISYFNLCFRRRFGARPSEFR